MHTAQFFIIQLNRLPSILHLQPEGMQRLLWKMAIISMLSIYSKRKMNNIVCLPTDSLCFGPSPKSKKVKDDRCHHACMVQLERCFQAPTMKKPMQIGNTLCLLMKLLINYIYMKLLINYIHMYKYNVYSFILVYYLHMMVRQSHVIQQITY